MPPNGASICTLLLGEALAPGAAVDLIRIRAEITPDTEASARYNAAAERQRALYRALYDGQAAG